MDALARPGLLCRIPAFPDARLDNPWLESLIRTLLDQNCSFTVAASASGKDVELAAHVSLMTSASRVAVAQAHFALIPVDAVYAEQTVLIEGLTGGTALSPERGATAIVECRRLTADAGSFLWQVTGPGVRSSHRFASSEDAWFMGRALRRDEFPCGIDLILVDSQGNVVGLPRTAQVTVPVLQKEA
jgi:alpha-D-ribose 1-methylphosphonate 5-triphosphate synthase subunit PhnH